jgi:hypothetical protein
MQFFCRATKFCSIENLPSPAYSEGEEVNEANISLTSWVAFLAAKLPPELHPAISAPSPPPNQCKFQIKMPQAKNNV